MKLRRNSKPYKILKTLAFGGGVLLLSVISPQGGAKLVQGILRQYLRKKRFEKEKFLRDLKHLQRRELIDYRELSDGQIELVLTKQGKREMLRFNLDDITIDARQKWDGRWRLIVFDIPEYKKKARNALRQKLVALGFYPIQKSVLITPHECEKEIDFVASFFDVRDHVLIFYIQKFEGEEKLKNYFKV